MNTSEQSVDQNNILLRMPDGEKNSNQVDITKFLTDLKENGPKNGIRMLVVGSGINTEGWKSAGAQTLDNNPTSGADYVGDANKLTEVLGETEYDCIFLEKIGINPDPQRGVNLDNLLPQIFKHLKLGGKLIIQTGIRINMNAPRSTWIPTPVEMKEMLQACGFQNTEVLYDNFFADLDNYRVIGDKQVFNQGRLDGRILYIAEKQ